MKSYQESCAIIGQFIGKIIAGLALVAWCGWVLMLVWNKVAWEFNLPTFSYLTYCGIWYVLRSIIKPITK